MRIAIITCYKQPDYIRAQTLRDGIAKYPGAEMLIIKNKHLNLLRYPEVIIRTLLIRIKCRPDVYLLTFRGYEVLPFLAILTWPKVLIYDEFINPIEWLQEPREQRWTQLIPKSMLKWFYRQILRRCRIILADTPEHAKYSKQLTSMSSNKFTAIPVSTNEKLFKSGKAALDKPKTKHFKVFYYGNMLPLHGLSYVLDATVALKNMPIEFLIVGGKTKTLRLIEAAQASGANIVYMPWTPFKNLPVLIKKSDLCLGGPFGGTAQAERVITGKTYQFLASGAPTVIGRNQSTRLFKDKQNCLLITQKSSKALITAIRWAYTNPGKLKSIGQNGHSLYKTNFSQQIVAQKLKTILDSVA